MPASSRPALLHSLDAEEFRAWYWLKAELVEFCQAHALPSTGVKRELEARIHSCLSGDTLIPGTRQPRRSGQMPSQFTPGTVIGAGWRCGPALAAFFREELGARFHFNAAMRDFIHKGQGERWRRP